MAGLLTLVYLFLRLPVSSGMCKNKTIHSDGFVQDSHLIPYSPFTRHHKSHLFDCINHSEFIDDCQLFNYIFLGQVNITNGEVDYSISKHDGRYRQFILNVLIPFTADKVL